MKKNIALGSAALLFVVLIGLLVWRGEGNLHTQSAGLANPASVNCVQNLGGTLAIVEEENGQAGYCHLPDGRVCEEWGLFRDGSCNAPAATSTPTFSDPKNGTYTIEGQSVTLQDGVSQVPAAPGSASQITTRYFGNEVTKDLDGNGTPDVAFLITQSGGGSGTFYYVVAALNTGSGYIGTQGYFLGDRIAPQTTEQGSGRSIIVNYADRKPTDPMSTPPSVGKSATLVLNTTTLAFENVEKGTTASGNSGIRGVVMLGPTCPVEQNPPSAQCADKPYTTLVVVFPANDPVHAIASGESGSDGSFSFELPPGSYTLGAGGSNLPRCDHPSVMVISGQYASTTISCDTGIR